MKLLVRVFETEEEALFSEWEDEVDSQQGSSSKDVKVTIVGLSDRVRLSGSSWTSGTQLAAEQTMLEDLGFVETIGEDCGKEEWGA